MFSRKLLVQYLEQTFEVALQMGDEISTASTYSNLLGKVVLPKRQRNLATADEEKFRIPFRVAYVILGQIGTQKQWTVSVSSTENARPWLHSALECALALIIQ